MLLQDACQLAPLVLTDSLHVESLQDLLDHLLCLYSCGCLGEGQVIGLSLLRPTPRLLTELTVDIMGHYHLHGYVLGGRMPTTID